MLKTARFLGELELPHNNPQERAPPDVLYHWTLPRRALRSARDDMAGSSGSGKPGVAALSGPLQIDRGRHAAAVLVLGFRPGPVFREAQDDRNECAGRL